jgi:CheY-like chemotaxis protein
MNVKALEVLLVEDNPADADLVEEALTEAQIDCNLSVVRDGAEAVGLIERLDSDVWRVCPDLILLDLNLPKVGGEAILERIRLSPRCGGVKVLIISSSDAPADRKRAMELGASDYFHKPSSLEQLFMEFGPTIRRLLEGTD